MAKKTYFCKPATDVEKGDVVAVEVLAGSKLHAGQIVKAETMNPTNRHNGMLNHFVYDAEVAELTDDLVILINDYFETMEDGRRPEGNPDFTTYEYDEGEVVTGVHLVENRLYRITSDCIKNGAIPAIGNFLVPDGTTHDLNITTTAPADVKFYLEVKAIKPFHLGGLFGGQSTAGFAKEIVAKVKRV